MEVKKIEVGKNFGFIEINSYLIINNNKCIIIDPGDEADKIISVIKKEKITAVSIILTHGHYDHIKDVKYLSDKLNIPVYIHENEKETLNSNIYNLSGVLGLNLQLFEITNYLKDGQQIDMDGEKLTIIHTPGHTPGCICIKGPDFLISGDTLFSNSLGRTDLPGSSEEDIIKSIKNKLLTLSKDLTVYPGHNENTTIEQERNNWGLD